MTVYLEHLVVLPLLCRFADDFAAWKAPEAISTGATEIASFSNDAYMFGSFLYELMTGSPPWHWIAEPETLLARRLNVYDLYYQNVHDAAKDAGKLRLLVRSSEPTGAISAIMDLMRLCLLPNANERPARFEI